MFKCVLYDIHPRLAAKKSKNQVCLDFCFRSGYGFDAQPRRLTSP